MTREQAVEAACAIVALAYHGKDDYRQPSDGFCERCNELHGLSWTYQNAGYALRYVYKAVVRALVEDGCELDKVIEDEIEALLPKGEPVYD